MGRFSSFRFSKPSDSESERESPVVRQELDVTSLHTTWKADQVEKDDSAGSPELESETHQLSDLSKELEKMYAYFRYRLELPSAGRPTCVPSCSERVALSQEPAIQILARPPSVGAENTEFPQLDLPAIRQASSIMTERTSEKSNTWQTVVQWKIQSSYAVGRQRECRRMPDSFDELIALIKEDNSFPNLWRIPHVMVFEELQGYRWRHALAYPITAEEFCDPYSEDQCQFVKIIGATIRTARRPLISPDYFLFTNQRRKRELEWRFHSRAEAPELKWDLSTKTKKNEQHPDWPLFCQFIVSKVPTGKYLFKRERGDWQWLSRTIVEDGYFPLDQEVVEFAKVFGENIELPKRNFLKTREWSAGDKLKIRTVAKRCWLRWRQEAEERLAAVKTSDR